MDQNMQQAKTYIKEGKLDQAKKLLEKITKSKFVSVEKKNAAAEQLKIIKKAKDQPKIDPKVQKIYDKSVELYAKQQYEQARKGFLSIINEEGLDVPDEKSPALYLQKIDTILVQRMQFPRPTPQQGQSAKPKPAEPKLDPEIINVAQPEQPAKPQKVEETQKAVAAAPAPAPKEKAPENQKLSLKQSYARAVVKDAVKKAQKMVEEGKYYNAKQAVEIAQNKLQKNRQCLSTDLYNQYIKTLEKLKKEIQQGRSSWLGDKALQK